MNINEIEVNEYEVIKPNKLDELKLQCLKCMKPIEEIPTCEICNGHTAINGTELLKILREE